MAMMWLTAGARRSSFTIAAALALLLSHYLVLHFLFLDTGSRHEGRHLQVVVEEDTQLPSFWDDSPLRHDPSNDNRDIIEDSAVISGRNVTYKLPANTFHDLSRNQDVGIVVGVLSAKQHREERNSIRETWSYRRKNVFFILAGDWKDVEEEFLDHQDIIWISTREGYYKLTWKTQAFIVAMAKHMKNFRHILKTDDDAYVRLAALEQASAFDFPDKDYIGHCMHGMKSAGGFLEPEYPPYASGAGYLVSKSFASCYAHAIEHWSSSVHEDANTGLIARQCHVDCHLDERIVPWRWSRGRASKDVLIQHYVTTPVEMKHLHAKSCSKTNADVISCTREMAEKSYENELPVWCGRYAAPTCQMCTTNTTVHRPRCAGDCHWCRPAFRLDTNEKIGRGICVPRAEECVVHGANGNDGGDNRNKNRHKKKATWFCFLCGFINDPSCCSGCSGTPLLLYF